MSGRAQRPPAGEPWVWLTRELLNSDAWRSLGINGRRFVDFLLLEHMSKGGRENGNLKAPHRQIIAFGVGARHTAAAIREAEEVGLVDCNRGGMRVATTYGLTWLPRSGGTAPSNRWRAYRNPDLPALTKPKSRNLPEKGKAGLPEKGKADGPKLPEKGMAGRPKNLPEKGKALSINSYQGGGVNSDLSTQRRGAASPLVGRGPEAHGALLTAVAGGPAAPIDARRSPGKHSANRAAPVERKATP